MCLEPSSTEQTYEARGKIECSNAVKSCEHIIKGRCDQGRLETGNDQYYFPEIYAEVLNTLPPNSAAEIVTDAKGNIMVKELYVQDQPIHDHARKHQKQVIR